MTVRSIASDIERVCGVTIALSGDMITRMELWAEMLRNEAPWTAASDVDGLRLPSSIACEFARLALIESKMGVSGSERGLFLDDILRQLRRRLKWCVRIGCACGGLVLKPYLVGRTLGVSAVTLDRVYPVAYDDNLNLTDVVLHDIFQSGSDIYHKLEHHKWNPATGSYTIDNTAYQSRSVGTLGDQCSLQHTGIWAGIAPSITLEGIYKPLFAHFRVPSLNVEDSSTLETPFGASVYADAVDRIKDADIQWARILWEYEGSELAVDVADDLLKPTKGTLRLPKRIERLFRGHDIDPSDCTQALTTFSPAIRDASHFNGLNEIFRRIEFACNLAYGTISNPNDVEKTAEEIRASKQRSYAAVRDIQEALEDALRELLAAADVYATLYKLAPQGVWEANFEWGDGVLEDTDKEFARRMQLCTAGKLKPEKLIAWYFGCSEEEAKDYIPEQAAGMQLFGGG